MRHTTLAFPRVLVNAAISLLGLVVFLVVEPAAQAQTAVYAITNTGVFGTLSLSSGAFHTIGSTGLTPAGLDGLGSNLFFAAQGSNVLYLVNPSNGNLSTVGSGSITYADLGSTTAGLYALDFSLNLYSINSANGSTTLIGPTGFGPCSGSSAISADGGALYGTCDNGSGSVLYSFNTATGAATPVGNSGVTRISSLVFAAGALYAASEGGSLYTLNPTNGTATLVVTTGQDLFGTALPTPSFAVLHTFTGGADGGLPFAGMILDSQGNLYGTAGAGGTGACFNFGTTGCGTIFELKRHNSSFIFNPLYSFRGGANDGEFPVRPLTLGPNGTYYGATLGGGEGTCSYDGVPGCGIVFNAGPNPTPPRTPLLTFRESVLYKFTGEGDGGEPFSTVIFDQSGDIYGTTFTGGAHGKGAVFKLTPSGGNYTESVVYSFAGGNDGAQPLDGLTFDTAGNLYGTTSAGGSTTACAGEGCGTVFKLTPSGSGYTESVIYAFQGGNDGKNPNAGVAIDAAGNLYGNTWQGGAGGGGTVYELSPNGSNWTFNLLYSVPNAGFAVGRVVLNSGNIYESLQDGGAFGYGQVFELVNSSGNWIYTDLYDFTDGADGANAIGGVVLDSSGNLYGTTTFGAGTGCGGGGCGTVWMITPQ